MLQLSKGKGFASEQHGFLPGAMQRQMAPQKSSYFLFIEGMGSFGFVHCLLLSLMWLLVLFIYLFILKQYFYLQR